MKKYLVWISLALLALTFAALEGLVDHFPQQLVQLNGLLTILFVMGLIVWTLKMLVTGHETSRSGPKRHVWW